MNAEVSQTIAVAKAESVEPGTRRDLSPGAPLDLSPGRQLDVMISLCALIFLAPLMLLVALCVYLVDPGPVLFGHQPEPVQVALCGVVRTKARRP